MLDKIRQNAQSWAIKLLFGLIVVVFIFWGVGSFRSNRASTLALVNDKPILVQDFVRAYESSVRAMRQQNPNLTDEALKNMRFKEQVLNQLINAELLTQKAKEWGLTITPAELRYEISQIPVFLNENKQFDPSRYQEVLKANSLTPAQFEEDYAHNLLMQKVQDYIALPTTPSDEEVREFFNFAREQMTINYIQFNWLDFKDKVKPEQKAVETYYDQHKNEFMEPAKIKIAYLELTPNALADKENISDQEVKNYYQAHKEQFKQEEMVKAKHILIKLNPDAPEEKVQAAKKKIARIQAELKKGKTFEELAKKYSQGPSSVRGGELGWFGRGQMVKKFEEAAFDLKPGQISEPVRTRFGLHLIKVDDYKAPGTKPLEEVKAEIKETIGQEKAADKIADLLDNVLELVVTGSDLKTAAKKFNLSVEESGFFTRKQGPLGLGLPPSAIDKLFKLQTGEVTQTPIMLEDGYVLAQKLDEKPAQAKPLEQVKDEIVQLLTKQGAMALAKQEAEDALAKILAAKDKPAPGFKDKIKTSEPFGRRGFIPKLGFNPELVEDLFQVEPGTWLSKAYELPSGYILAQAKEHILPKEEDFAKEKKFWLASYARIQEQQLFQAFITDLRNKAKIEIVNPKILEY
ncbi:SurA N-terminal domain-containing protein [Desulfohalobiaceae bacterium Ax17]|uniref:SurA N-terminal domain-containing protein n=1 Tax=Desulfovulcanus ferrireducens TaxID=2831190 RepID=UPI00207BA6C5|nr:SurA N-terminal domain-containing protein [Desulfovulcanus ferrireducens]MBT8763701.1 SurA N-terminal domain-containing protein [Desulfovulcanus ferrireducens]